jgi:DNA-binding NtrC family response regulator
LAPSLIHSELFGFEKGAFTGAHQRTIGYLEAARGGSVFLDEIGDLHPELQGLLLRFFDEQSVRRLGGREAISIDARVIAATNVDLETAVRDKRFREDLYHRLNVLRLHLPPLRERPEDIDALSHSLLERYARDSPGRLRGFSKAAMMALRSHSWPGNVRELVNRVRHAVVMADGRQITPEDLRLGVVSGDQPLARLDVARLAAERHTILEALRRTGWNACKSAELIGVSRATFYRLLDRHGLKAEDA